MQRRLAGFRARPQFGSVGRAAAVGHRSGDLCDERPEDLGVERLVNDGRHHLRIEIRGAISNHRRHDKDNRTRLDLTNVGNDLIAVQYRHHEIEDDEIEPLPPQQVKRLFTVSGGRGIAPVPLGDGAEQFSDEFIIIGDQNSGHVSFS